jgi:hypothetical protein
MKAFIAIVLFTWSSWASLVAHDDHDIHVCLSEVRWNASTSSFEASVKVFIDDLELALSKHGAANLFIGTEKESAAADSHIEQYLDKHFRMTINGAAVLGNFIGKELAEDKMAIWCYIEFPVSKTPQNCSIANDVFFELYDDQRNILEARMSTSHKAYTILEPDKRTWSYTF